MKRIIFIFLASSIAVSVAISLRQRQKRSSDTSRNARVRSLNFFQKLDHFNPANDEHWYQRYWISATYYKKFGPAFLFLHGEVVIKPHIIEMYFPSTWLAYAKEVNAICFSLEHRFYGEGWPVNKSITLLSTRQALSDTENFIKTMNKEFKFKHTRWIVFGLSYSANMAVWMRLKYPRLIYASVSSSPPLLATGDFYQYQEIVEKSIKAYNPKCMESLTSAVEEIALYIKMNKKIKIERNISFNSSISETVNFLRRARPEYMEPKDALYDMVQTINYAVRDNAISTVCDTLINYEGSKVQAYFELDKMNVRRQIDDAIMPFRNYHDDPKARVRDGWRYQRCSELGFFVTYSKTTYLSAVSHLLPQYEDGVKETCAPFFGSNFSTNDLHENINRTNLFYGGLDINIDNVVLINGSLDPWHQLSIYQQKNGSLYDIIFIKGAAHCADTYPASDKDIPELKNARSKILELLKLWLNKNHE